MTTHTKADIPEYVIVREMDRAVQLAEDAKRLHDELAAELGFERVRINNVDVLDKLKVIDAQDRPVVVEVVNKYRTVDPSGVELWHVDLFDPDVGPWGELYDDGELVSRLLPPENDVF